MTQDASPIAAVAARAKLKLDLDADDPRYLEMVDAVQRAESISDLPAWIIKAGALPPRGER